MGLIAIYISLNSQNKVEKAREIFWDLGKLSLDGNYGKDSLKKLIWYRYHYSELVKANIGNTIVVAIAVITIGFVGSAWGYYIFYLNQKIFTTVLGIVGFVSIMIMVSFIILLLLFLKVSFIGGLPKHEKLFSLGEKKNPLVNMGDLILYHCPLHIGKYTDVPDKTYIKIELPFYLNLKKKSWKLKFKKTRPFLFRQDLLINFEFSIKIFKGEILKIGGADQILNELDSIITYSFTDRRHFYLSGDITFEGEKLDHNLYQELYFDEKEGNRLLEVIHKLQKNNEKYTILGQLTAKDGYSHSDYPRYYRHMLYTIPTDLNSKEEIFPFRAANWVSLGSADQQAIQNFTTLK